MRKLIVFCICISSSIYCISQTDSTINGKWYVCYSMKLDSSENCNSNKYVTYDFHSDGTYSDSREYIINGKKHKYHGTWGFNGTILTIDAADENGMSIPVQNFEIIWLNDSLFYTVGTEGPGGPTVYTYFKKKLPSAEPLCFLKNMILLSN